VAANTPTLKQPAIITPPFHRRLTGALAAGTVTANGVAIKEVIALGANVRFLTIRCAAATANVTLAFDFVSPLAKTDVYTLQSGAVGAIDPAQVTPYGDGLGGSVTVTAGTPNFLQVTCCGESYGLITVTGTGAGTLTFVDVSAL